MKKFKLVIFTMLAIVGVSSCNSPKSKDVDESEEESAVSVDESQREVVLTPEFIEKINTYDDFSSFSDGYAAVKKVGKWGYVNVECEEVIACKFDYAGDFGDGLAPVGIEDGEYGYRMGYINTEGELVIPYKYSGAMEFNDGLALVNDDGYFYIDTNGDKKIQLPEESSEYYVYAPFSEGLACRLKLDYSNYDPRLEIFDKKGIVLFSVPFSLGFYEGEGFQVEAFQTDCVFYNGELYVPRETGSYDFVFDVYNKQGKLLRTENNWNARYEIDYMLYETRTLVKENGDVFGADYLIGSKYGIAKINKDGTPQYITAAEYNSIDYFGCHTLCYGVDGEYFLRFKNGVALATITEFPIDAVFAGEDDAGFVSHVGFVDKYGNDTFKDEIKFKCRQSVEQAIKWANSQR